MSTNRTNDKKTEKLNRQVEQTSEQQSSESTLDVFSDAAHLFSGGSVESQAETLAQGHSVQRQKMMGQIGRTQGNRHAQRLISTLHKSSSTSAKPQTKLSVSEPGDPYEQEADRMADEVMRSPSPAPPPPPAGDSGNGSSDDEIHRQLLPTGTVQTSGEGSPEVDENVESSVKSLKGAGRPLPSEDRGFFEDRMSADFSDVRIHTGDKAQESSKALNARAYTVGSDIAFDRSEYQPGTQEGRRLLAHELTHVIQQGGAQAKRAPESTSNHPQVQRAQAVEVETPQVDEQVDLPPEQKQALEAKTPGDGEAYPEPGQAAAEPTAGEAPTAENVSAAEERPEGVEHAPTTAEAEGPSPELPPEATVATDGAQPDEAAAEPAEAQAESAAQQEPAAKGKEEKQEERGDAAPEQGAAEDSAEKGEIPSTPEGEQAQKAVEETAGVANEQQAGGEATNESAKADSQAAKSAIEAEKEKAQGESAEAEAKVEDSVSSIASLASSGISFAPPEEEAAAGEPDVTIARQPNTGGAAGALGQQGRQLAQLASQQMNQFLGQSAGHAASISALSSTVAPQLSPTSQSVIVQIQAAIASNEATIASAVAQIRADVQSEAAAAEAELQTQYSTVTDSIRTSTQSARDKITNEHTSKLTELQTLATTSKASASQKVTTAQSMIQRGASMFGQQAVALGNKWKGVYQGESYPEPGFFEGKNYYENKRKAKVNAAQKVAESYKKEFEEKGKVESERLSGAVNDVSSEVDATITSVEDALTQEKESALQELDHKEQSSLQSAETTLQGQLQMLDESRAATETSLEQLEQSLLTQLHASGEQQIAALESMSQQAMASLQESISQGAASYDEGVQNFAGQVSGISAPDPQQLAAILGQAQGQLSGSVEQFRAEIAAQVATVQQTLQTQGQQAVEELNQIGMQATAQSSTVGTDFSGQLSALVESAVNALTELESGHTSEVDEKASTTVSHFDQAYTQGKDRTDQILTCLETGLNKHVQDFLNGPQGLQNAVKKVEPDIQQKADEAAAKVQPAWKKVVATVLTVIISVVVAVAIGALVASGIGFGLGLLLAAGIGALGGVAKGLLKNWSEGEALTKDLGKNALLGAIDGMLQFAGGRYLKKLNLPEKTFRELATKTGINTAIGTVNDMLALGLDNKLTTQTAFTAIFSNLLGGVVNLGSGSLINKVAGDLPATSWSKAAWEMGINTTADTATDIGKTVIKGEELTWDKALGILGQSTLKNALSTGAAHYQVQDRMTGWLNQEFDVHGAQIAAQKGYPEAPEGYHWARNGAEAVLTRNPNSGAPPLQYDNETRQFVQPPQSAGAQMAANEGYPAAPKGYHWAKSGDQPILRRNPGKANDPGFPPLEYDAATGQFVSKQSQAALDTSVGKATAEHDYATPGPLPDDTAATFSGQRYRVVELQEDQILYRAGTADTPLGQFFSKDMPVSEVQTRMDKAVLPVWPDGGKSPIDMVFSVRIPKGTQVYVGEVAYQGDFYFGGTEQIVVIQPWNVSGVEVVDHQPIQK